MCPCLVSLWCGNVVRRCRASTELQLVQAPVSKCKCWARNVVRATCASLPVCQTSCDAHTAQCKCGRSTRLEHRASEGHQNDHQGRIHGLRKLSVSKPGEVWHTKTHNERDAIKSDCTDDSRTLLPKEIYEAIPCLYTFFRGNMV